MADQIVYVVTGHCDYEDCACMVGVYSSKEVAESVRCEREANGHYGYYIIDETILDHPEKEIK